eukprot:EG_transcript_8782
MLCHLLLVLFALALTAVPCASSESHVPEGTGVAGAIPVAVYLVGEPATLNQTLCSLADNVLRPLGQQGFTASIFIYARWNPTVDQYDLLNAALPGMQIVSVVSNYTPSIPTQCANDLSHQFNDAVENSRKHLLRLHDLEGIDDTRRRFEVETGVRFQWVVLLRPDVTYIDPIPDLRTLSTSHIHVPVWHPFGSLQEGVAIMSRSLTAHFFGMYADLCVLGMSRAIPAEVQNVEGLYRWLLHFYLVPINAIRNFFFIRTRPYRTAYGHFAPQDILALGPERCDRAVRYRCFLFTPETTLTSPFHAPFPQFAAHLASQCWRARQPDAQHSELVEKYIEQLTGQSPSTSVAVHATHWHNYFLVEKALQVFWAFAGAYGGSA